TYARPVSRAEAYATDITYGTNNEYGFDYLRDNMAFSKDDLVQRETHYAIVDEVDSILIDEARTPLIISGMVEQSTEQYRRIDDVVAKMSKGVDDPKNDKDNPNADKHKANIHYVIDEKAKTATITEAGVPFIERALGMKNITEDRELMHYLSAAMKAHGVFRKDIDYVVKDAGKGEGPEIIIVDENTGRMMFGRRYSDGLHQAIEAKEHVEVKNESQTLATITFQNYFRLYSKLSGMTGTAKTEEEEFRKIYALDVLPIPTNRPVVRKDKADMIFKREEHKMRAIAAEILRVFCKQQPTLIGTRSIEMSERVSKRVSPQMLRTLTLIEVIRQKVEGDKSIPNDKKREYTALLNMPMEPWSQVDEEGKRGNFAPLSIQQLRPVLKALNLPEDPLAPANMNTVATLFEIADGGLELLEEALTHGIPHNILNAKFHEKEAIIIAEAGRKGAITIATNMAGRGVDILLGGKHINQELPTTAGDVGSLSAAVSSLAETADEEGAEAEDVENEDYRRFGRPAILDAVTSGGLTDEEHKRAGDAVRAVGGVYILGTERHESRRIDNQLRGRAGRQGDPGESRFFVSMEDELMRLFGDRANAAILRSWEDHLGMDSALLSKMIERAQKKVEEHYFESRKHVLNYDDVMNRQRELIYRERRRILEGEDLRDTVISYMGQTVEESLLAYCPPSRQRGEWEIEELYREMNEYFQLEPDINEDDLRNKSSDAIEAQLTTFVINRYEGLEKQIDEQDPGFLREIERNLALRAVNSRWMEHLANMDYLREGIHLRGYEQKDPLLIYQKEAFDEFMRMQAAIQDDIVRNLFRMQFTEDVEEYAPPPTPTIIALPEFAVPTESERAEVRSLAPVTPTPLKKDLQAPPGWKGGRNDPCWCGSGQKHKRCHGK
ncbi:MAG: SEC-C metal-binding domain-containing protein, partial [Armatimonadetes bacterium]|nr:SEC-C metal-binding domain-containing protein [Armatimonadota bacterium]